MLLLLLLLPLDRRFGIQLSNYQEGQLQQAEATWQPGNVLGRRVILVCFVLPMHVGTWPLFMTSPLFLYIVCPILRPFNGISSSLHCCQLLHSSIILFVTPIESVTVQCLALPSTPCPAAASFAISVSALATSASIEFSFGKARVQISVVAR